MESTTDGSRKRFLRFWFRRRSEREVNPSRGSSRNRLSTGCNLWKRRSGRSWAIGREETRKRDDGLKFLVAFGGRSSRRGDCERGLLLDLLVQKGSSAIVYTDSETTLDRGGDPASGLLFEVEQGDAWRRFCSRNTDSRASHAHRDRSRSSRRPASWKSSLFPQDLGGLR